MLHVCYQKKPYYHAKLHSETTGLMERMSIKENQEPNKNSSSFTHLMVKKYINATINTSLYLEKDLMFGCQRGYSLL